MDNSSEDSQKREYYAIRHLPTGGLLRLETNTFGAFSHKLSTFEAFPVFQAKTAADVLRVLKANTPYYNSSESLPGWGDISRDDMVPVFVTETIEFSPVTVPEHQEIAKTLEVRRIPLNVAQRYAGADAHRLPTDQPIFFLLALLPQHLSWEQAKAKWTGRSGIAVNDWSSRTVYAVCNIPEDYLDLFKPETPALLDGYAGALLLTSDLEY